jgi:hypothetical protein
MFHKYVSETPVLVPEDNSDTAKIGILLGPWHANHIQKPCQSKQSYGAYLCMLRLPRRASFGAAYGNLTRSEFPLYFEFDVITISISSHLHHPH